MTRFQVPQFIETETKVVGPFTLKQFIYIGIGGLLIFLMRYLLTSFTLFLMAAVVIALLAVALAFYKIEDIPLPNYLYQAFLYSLGVKKYTFTKNESKEDITTIENIHIKN